MHIMDLKYKNKQSSNILSMFIYVFHCVSLVFLNHIEHTAHRIAHREIAPEAADAKITE